MKNKPTFSLIGTGFIMPRHAEAIDFVGGTIIDVVNEYQGENAWKKMVKKTKADYIVILTPNDLHFEMVVESAKAKKMVLCEKPLCLTSEQVEILKKYKNIFTVVQLRQHPYTLNLREKIKSNDFYEIEMDISVHRDEKYYKTWKGQEKRSGGIMFNLGIHYFDLLIYLFGKPEKIENSSYSAKNASGVLKGKKYICRWHLSTDEPRESQKRVFKINGINYNFSSKDNLSYENLHRKVYQDLVQKKGITPEDIADSIKLIENIKKKAK